MKKIIFLLLVLVISIPARTQTDSSEIADKLAIKELVDVFSNLADEKKATEQTLLFTPNATVETYSNGKLVTSLKGRQQIGETFGNFLVKFKTVYHMNGQQTVSINGDTAFGKSYCMVTLIDDTGGKIIKTSIGVIYNDEYARVDGKWLINKRISNFTWQDSQTINQ